MKDYFNAKPDEKHSEFEKEAKKIVLNNNEELGTQGWLIYTTKTALGATKMVLRFHSLMSSKSKDEIGALYMRVYPGEIVDEGNDFN